MYTIAPDIQLVYFVFWDCLQLDEEYDHGLLRLFKAWIRALRSPSMSLKEHGFRRLSDILEAVCFHWQKPFRFAIHTHEQMHPRIDVCEGLCWLLLAAAIR